MSEMRGPRTVEHRVGTLPEMKRNEEDEGPSYEDLLGEEDP